MEIRSALYDPYGRRRWTTGVAAGDRIPASPQRAEEARSKPTKAESPSGARATRTAKRSELSNTLTAEERELLDRLFPTDRVGRGIRSYRSSSIRPGTDVRLGRRIDLRH